MLLHLFVTCTFAQRTCHNATLSGIELELHVLLGCRLGFAATAFLQQSATCHTAI